MQTAVYEEYERILTGEIDWREYINAVIVAIDEAVLEMVYEALRGVYDRMPQANKHGANAFDKTEFDKILNTVKAYGSKPIIFCPTEKLGDIPYSADRPSDEDLSDLRNKGYIGMYRGCVVVELPNSFKDETNTEKVFEANEIFILPSSADAKVVAVALEGGLITKQTDMEDWTVNFEAYQKVAVSVMQVNHIGIFKYTV